MMTVGSEEKNANTTASADATSVGRGKEDGAGFIHVYTGDGKGKTTAALGLAFRAAGAGWPVFFGQFAKCGEFSEMAALQRFADTVTVRQFGADHFIESPPSEADVRQALEGFHQACQAVFSGEYRLVVLDEINCAVGLGLIPVGDVLRLMEEKPEGVELVLTGRWAREEVIARADLVTEMHEVKHYYQEGVVARTGIEK